MRGRIIKALSGFYYVDTGDKVVTCRARGRFRKDGISPLVGDLVEIESVGSGEGIVDQILPRRNYFDRPAVANIDQLVIVASKALPQTDPFLVDRMTAIAELKNCSVLICINKCDLDNAQELADYYHAVGYPTLQVSAETGENLDLLRAELTGKLSAFTGNSGVGKSSLLNALDPRFALKVGEISQALHRGKHTTRHVELFKLADGAEIIDTPGFASFEAEKLAFELKEHLAETFVEFSPYLGECRFVGCSHTKEKGCAVLDAVKSGKIGKGRHMSYLRLYEELKDLKAWNV
ncbi:MAG: ribosome small subunit-dependent GTPase A [Oscillospiraceae bacterium]|nr:ribosome small subunit-dependent GTPase A [Oscillospiraceae bacterium]